MTDLAVPGTYPNIAAALAAALASDRVLLSDGTYPALGNTALTIPFNNITIEGESGDAENVIIDAENLANFLINDKTGLLLKHFTIKNCNSILLTGGGAAMSTAGLYCEDVIFDSCQCQQSGGAVALGLYGGLFKNCIFKYNKTVMGNGGAVYGGTFYQGEDMSFVNCLFYENEAQSEIGNNGRGGGIYSDTMEQESALTCWFCTFWKNLAAQGGGGVFYRIGDPNSVNFNDCIFWLNTGAGNGDQVLGPIMEPPGPGPNAIFTLCPAGVNDVVPPWNLNTSPIITDPLFAVGGRGPTYLAQIAAGQAPPNSPAMDSGDQPATGSVIDGLTTRTDEVADSGTADRGFHFIGEEEPPTPWEFDTVKERGCDNCDHFQSYGLLEQPGGECRAHPPVKCCVELSPAANNWPQIDLLPGRVWCDEWKRTRQRNR